MQASIHPPIYPHTKTAFPRRLTSRLIRNLGNDRPIKGNKTGTTLARTVQQFDLASSILLCYVMSCSYPRATLPTAFTTAAGNQIDLQTAWKYCRWLGIQRGSFHLELLHGVALIGYVNDSLRTVYRLQLDIYRWIGISTLVIPLPWRQGELLLR